MKTSAILSFVFGLLGVVLVIAGVIATWIVTSRMREASGELVKIADTTLTGVRERIGETEERVANLRLTAEDFHRGIMQGTDDVEGPRKGETLKRGLLQVDHVLELAESKLTLIQRTMRIGGKLRGGKQHEKAAELATKVGAIRGQVADCLKVMENISEDLASGETREKIGTLGARVVVGLGAVDDGLVTQKEKVSDLQAKLREAEASTSEMLRTIAIVTTLVGVWMGAGQVSLLRRGREGFSSER